jgi:alkylhydroperoxidase/carboxymuconolactone decarboxylase family protein YurZ
MNIVTLRAFRDEFEKISAELTPEARSKLPGKDFAVKAKKSNTGKEAYPIPDRQHARSALGFAKMHGDEADLSAVRAKIKAKYPDMLKAANVIERLGQAMGGPGEHLTELAGLGLLAVPGADQLQAHARAAMSGDYNKEGVRDRELLPAIAHPLSDVAGLGVLAAPEVMKLRHA